MALYVFLDEAVNLHDDRDRHGVLVAFVTEQPKATRKYFVRAKQTKLPRKYQHYAEIKFQRSGRSQMTSRNTFCDKSLVRKSKSTRLLSSKNTCHLHTEPRPRTSVK